jgi:hypothetical protein
MDRFAKSNTTYAGGDNRRFPAAESDPSLVSFNATIKASVAGFLISRWGLHPARKIFETARGK